MWGDEDVWAGLYVCVASATREAVVDAGSASVRACAVLLVGVSYKRKGAPISESPYLYPRLPSAYRRSPPPGVACPHFHSGQTLRFWALPCYLRLQQSGKAVHAAGPCYNLLLKGGTVCGKQKANFSVLVKRFAKV